MDNKLFLIFLLSLWINFSVGCSQNKVKISSVDNQIETDDYSKRVKNITQYLQLQNIDISDTCTDIFIIQASKCGSCSEESFALLKQEFASTNNIKKIFILTEKNIVAQTFIKKNFPSETTRMFYDINDKLAQYGLYFMKNTYIAYCNKSVASWKFIGRIDE